MIKNMKANGEITEEDIAEEDKTNPEEESISVCITCGQMFETKFKLAMHMRQRGINHNNKCPRCPEVEFSSWPEHQEHQKKVHGRLFFSRCKHCPFENCAFENRQHLNAHYIDTHKKDVEQTKMTPRFKAREQCSECGLFVSDIKRHRQVRHGPQVKQYQCGSCKKWYLGKSDLRKHMKHVHNMICCVACGKKIPEAKFGEHNLYHHTPEHEKPFVCSICVPIKGFVAKGQYDDHLNIHNGIKPHVCKLCPNVSYASRGNLAAHTRATHQGKKRKPKQKKASQ